MAEATFSVVGVSETAARMNVKARDFDMIVDEPPALGGDDKGANPVEYVLAGLVGCLNVMCHLIAKEMDLNVQKLEIAAEGPIELDKLFGKPTDARAGYKGITVNINLKSDAEDEAIAKWLKEVESRCPVSDNLSNMTPLNIQYKQL